jgi:hypothetical protein
VDIGSFRSAFPEFTDTTKYSSASLEFWAVIAESQVRQCVWQDLYTQGVMLYVAHEITLAAQNQLAAQVGGSPGQQGGIANSKTVGSVSVGYDSQSNVEKDAGYWNLTNYGKQYINLSRILGVGSIQL